jgi:hypothetical protein
VIALGDGVDPDWAGRAVAAHTGERGGSGGYAGQVAVAAGDLIPCRTASGWPRPPRCCTTDLPLACAADAHAALEARTAVAKTLLLT